MNLLLLCGLLALQGYGTGHFAPVCAGELRVWDSDLPRIAVAVSYDRAHKLDSGDGWAVHLRPSVRFGGDYTPWYIQPGVSVSHVVTSDYQKNSLSAMARAGYNVYGWEAYGVAYVPVTGQAKGAYGGGVELRYKALNIQQEVTAGGLVDGERQFAITTLVGVEW